MRETVDLIAMTNAAAPVQPRSGLSSAEAARRLRVDGPNELPSQRPRTLLRIAREVLLEPMFLLLIAAAAIYIALGDAREAAILTASMLVVLLITVLQERRTEHALARLKDLSSPRALVLRDGREQRIAGRDVVVGDIVLLREGDRAPADGVLLSATALSADESILTGESLPADKTIDAGSPESARVYSGSLIVRGFGVAEITATGVRSQIGRIGRALASLATETTPLYREIRRIVRWVAALALGLCALIAVIYGATRADWLNGVLAGVTVAMGVLPEEFPVVLTVFLAMGAWRISRAGVLTRRMPAIETIGAATVLAVDKTGTLTENRMRVALIETLDASFDLRDAAPTLDENAVRVLTVALEASERDPFDPMERAIHEEAHRSIATTAASLRESELVREYDLTPELLAVTHVWRKPDASDDIVAVKGAPETVLDLCRIEASMRETYLSRIAAHAKHGLRLLAVARGVRSRQAALPDSPRAFKLELLGFVGLADPLRADVPAALAECKQAGIRVVMITGDHPGTALAIAAQAGFDTAGGALTGAELDALSDAELRERARSVNVYARATPEAKLRLVQAFKDNGEVIAMTGDGVNDAPALKAAHVGVAMGSRGTDVAREAAALVLVNDDFASLVQSVRLGRRIYSNLQHAMSYIIAVHIPIAGLGLLPVLLGQPLLFYPLHVLFLEFVIDPACAFVFEADPESPRAMRRKPRSPSEPLFSRAVLTRSLWLGVGALALIAVIYSYALHAVDVETARALAFTALVASNLALIFVSRSQSADVAAVLAKRNDLFWWIAGLASLALLAAIYAPPVADIFQFSPPTLGAMFGAAACATALVFGIGLILRQRDA